MKTLETTCVDLIVSNSVLFAKAIDDKSPLSKSLQEKLVNEKDFVEIQINMKMGYETYPKRPFIYRNN